MKTTVDIPEEELAEAMRYAKTRTQRDAIVLAIRQCAPGGARADTLEAWPRAHALALGYWERLAGDERVSGEFRGRARECGEIVGRTGMRG